MRRLLLMVGVAALFALPGMASAQSLRQRCEQKKTEIDGLKTQATTTDAEIAKVTDKIDKIRKRLQMFEQKRADMARERATLTNRIKAEETGMARMCRGLEQCAKLDKRADDLQARLNPMYDQLRALREEIRKETQQIGGLNGDVTRISNQYQQLNCEDLVPGQTAQATIDQCHNLFSEWNAAAARITSLEGNIKKMRQRYQGLIGQVQAVNREIARLRGEMAKDCSDSQRYATLEQLDKQRGEYEGMKAELDEADNNVNKLRLLKLSQTKDKKKPQLKKAP